MAWSLGGDLQDTLLLGPARLAADSAGVYVTDPVAGRVLRAAPDGRVLWSSGHKGGGPGEFRSLRSIALDASGRPWLLDRRSARITVLDTTGDLLREIPLAPEARSADGLVPDPDGLGVLVTLYDRDRPLARLDVSGRIRERMPFPWSGYRELHPLQSQFRLAGGPGGRRIVALAMGDGFWIGGPEGWRPWRGRYVEPVPFPRVETRSRGGDRGRRVLEEGIVDEPPVFAAVSVVLTRTSLLVLFSGSTPDAGRLVDLYSIEDGRYRGTLLLPRPCIDITYAGGTLYAITSETVPRLVAWRRLEGGLP